MDKTVLNQKPNDASMGVNASASEQVDALWQVHDEMEGRIAMLENELAEANEQLNAAQNRAPEGGGRDPLWPKILCLVFVATTFLFLFLYLGKKNAECPDCSDYPTVADSMTKGGSNDALLENCQKENASLRQQIKRMGESSGTDNSAEVERLSKELQTMRNKVNSLQRENAVLKKQL